MNNLALTLNKPPQNSQHLLCLLLDLVLPEAQQLPEQTVIFSQIIPNKPGIKAGLEDSRRHPWVPPNPDVHAFPPHPEKIWDLIFQSVMWLKHQQTKRKNDIYRSSRWASGSWDAIETRRTLSKTEQMCLICSTGTFHVPCLDLLCLLFLLHFQGIQRALFVPKNTAST